MSNISELASKAELNANLAPVKAEIAILRWMIGFVLAFVIAMTFRLFLH